MKNILKILIIFVIAFIVGSIIVFINYDRTISNLDIKEIEEVKNLEEIEKDSNILVSGNIESRKEEIVDEEYKLVTTYQMLKRVKNVPKGLNWVDEDPVYILNELYIKNLKISDDIMKKLDGYELLLEGDNFNIGDSDIMPMHYSDSDDLFFATMEETGLWRLRYYKNEIDSNKEYTVVGKWNGKEIMPIEGIEKSLYEGKISKRDFDYQKNGVKQSLIIIFPCLAVILAITTVILFVYDKKKNNK